MAMNPDYNYTLSWGTPTDQPDSYYQMFQKSIALTIERDIAGYALSLNVSPDYLDTFVANMKVYIGMSRRTAQDIYKFAIELAYNLSKRDEEDK